MGVEIAVKEHAAYTVANGRGRLWRAAYQVGPDMPRNRTQSGTMLWFVSVQKRRDIVDRRWDPASIWMPSIQVCTPYEASWLSATIAKACDLANMLDRCLPTGSEA